jgi:hypothetical protein
MSSRACAGRPEPNTTRPCRAGHTQVAHFAEQRLLLQGGLFEHVFGVDARGGRLRQCEGYRLQRHVHPTDLGHDVLFERAREVLGRHFGALPECCVRGVHETPASSATSRITTPLPRPSHRTMSRSFAIGAAAGRPSASAPSRPCCVIAAPSAPPRCRCRPAC